MVNSGFEPAIGHNDSLYCLQRILIGNVGGGYAWPGSSQIDFHWEIQSKSNEEVAVVVLSYSLAPAAQYPTQLRQAVELVRYLIYDAGKSPSNVYCLLSFFYLVRLTCVS